MHQEIKDRLIDLVAQGKIVRIVSAGETLGFLMPEGFLLGEANFTYAGIKIHVAGKTL